MNNQEMKRNKWDILKPELLSIVPTEFAIDVEGLDDESIYFHPIIKIDDKFIVRGQSDVASEYGIYAWGLKSNQTQALGGLLYEIEFDINDLNHLKQVLGNWEKYKIKIDEYVTVVRITNENINTLEQIKRGIQSNLLYDEIDKEDKQKWLNDLFKVKEWIENERIIERYN